MDWPACFLDLNPIEHVWEELSESVSLYTTHCIICASSFWKNGYAFHNAIFKFSSIVFDAVVEILVVCHKILIRLNGAY